jgi:hypothetical protein
VWHLLKGLDGGVDTEPHLYFLCTSVAVSKEEFASDITYLFIELKTLNISSRLACKSRSCRQEVCFILSSSSPISQPCNFSPVH